MCLLASQRNYHSDRDISAVFSDNSEEPSHFPQAQHAAYKVKYREGVSTMVLDAEAGHEQPSLSGSEGVTAGASTIPSRTTEQARDREFYKYYTPYQAAIASGNAVRQADENGRPRSAYDKALLAFAQLGALRMRARRCMISMFDSNHQFCLAEATKTLSLQTDEAESPEDAVKWGVCQIPRDAEPLCENAINLPLQFIDTENDQKAEVGVVCFPDLTQHLTYLHYPVSML